MANVANARLATACLFHDSDCFDPDYLICQLTVVASTLTSDLEMLMEAVVIVSTVSTGSNTVSHNLNS